jgi:hypothetical protein
VAVAAVAGSGYWPGLLWQKSNNLPTDAGFVLEFFTNASWSFGLFTLASCNPNFRWVV